MALQRIQTSLTYLVNIDGRPKEITVEYAIEANLVGEDALKNMFVGWFQSMDFTEDLLETIRQNKTHRVKIY